MTPSADPIRRYVHRRFEVTLTEIDYTQYTLEELLECKESIDGEAYPERLAQINILIKERIKDKPVQRVSIADEDGNIASIKTGRAPSFGLGVGEIAGSILFGLIWLNQTDNESYFHLIGYFVILSGCISGAYHLYNAFAKNRFSAQDIVAHDKEKDPFESTLNRLSNGSDNKYCGDCGTEVEKRYKFCPKCGNKF